MLFYRDYIINNLHIKSLQFNFSLNCKLFICKRFLEMKNIFFYIKILQKKQKIFP